jgi:hypothetical protein
MWTRVRNVDDKSGNEKKGDDLLTVAPESLA